MKEDQLEKIARSIVNPESSFGELFGAIQDLGVLLSEASGLNLQDASQKFDVQTEDGVAIGPHRAAICMNDLLRTCNYIKGLYAAILASKGKNKNQTIKVIYAGCGPFATLAIPIMALFQSDEVQFNLLDVVEGSYKYAKQTINKLNLDAYVSNIECLDASKYQIEEEVFDVLLVECMGPALKKEAQVAITLNLAPQIHKDGIIIPESVNVDFGFIELEENQKRMLNQPYDENYIVKVENLICLDKVFATNNTEDSKVLIGKEIETSELNLNAGHKAALITSIKVFGEIGLKIWDCALTQPVYIKEIEAADFEDYESIQFAYKLGKNPGFQHNIVKFKM